MLVERVFFADRTTINTQQKASIAVLPFSNTSTDDSFAFYASAIPSRIIDELAIISGLKVIAEISSFSMKGSEQGLKSMAELLDVNYILDGKVYYNGLGEKIKISTQLINANNGFIMWSETFEEDLDRIQNVEESISRKIASNLRVQLLPNEDEALAKKLTDNSDAYELYLKSREYSTKRTDRDLRKAIAFLNQSVELEPNFAEAHAELSFLYGLLYGYGSLGKEERDERKKFHLNKALEINPNKPEVLFANAQYKMDILNKDSSQVISDIRKAIELKPNYSDAHYLLFRALNWAKQSELSIKSLQKAVELDPYNSFHTSMLVNRLRSRGEYERAMAIANRHLDVFPEDHRMGLIKGIMLIDGPYGDLSEGFKLIYRRYKNDPTERWNLNYTLNVALNLDIWPLAEKLARIIQLRYSDTRAVYNNLSTLHYFKKEYSDVKEIIDYSEEIGVLDKETFIEESSWLNLLHGNPSKAIEIYENGFPDITTPKILNDKWNLSLAERIATYIELLRANGQEEKANGFAKRLCTFKDEAVKQSLLGENPTNWLILECYYATNDISGFLQFLENIFFEKKNRMYLFVNLKSEYYRRFEKDPEYQKLFKRIEAETHRMRAEVIAFLKEQGDWNPAWDKELGLE
ncbi:MAG: hypothetical protein HKP08_07160 [Flavobacteriaceae bacterium]|nr:hypothetical protein [Flavobacteriaceae bacterium]